MFRNLTIPTPRYSFHYRDNNLAKQSLLDFILHNFTRILHGFNEYTGKTQQVFLGLESDF